MGQTSAETRNKNTPRLQGKNDKKKLPLETTCNMNTSSGAEFKEKS
jgi:hypothetical protein